ncbi:MAG: histidine kinase [Saprospiraceae bacterium]|nr:histidine kinase [Saprospiraceae bacterium]
MIQSIVQWLLRNRALQHVLFWSLSFYILLRFFAYSEEIATSDVVYTALFHISLLVVVYINLLILIPYLLRNGKYLLYILFLAIILIFGVWLNELTFNHLGDWLFPGYYFISYYEWKDLSQFMLVYLSSSTLLKLSKAWFWLQEAERRLEQLQSEKKEAELSALKAQLDPHFLFNSLNSLYSLALDGDVRTPAAILKLSDSMRYMLYECNAPQVSLAKELAYLQNYLDLQELRNSKADSFQFETNIYNNKLQIAPLLFIPFVENAFKHGERNSIRIQLITKEKELLFSVENHKKNKQPELNEHHNGIGLQNIRRRLELLYPGKHQLKLIDNEAIFHIYLKLYDI